MMLTLCKSGRLPKYAQAYYESILADYQSTPTPAPGDAVAVKAAEEAKEILHRHPKIAWNDIYALEIAVLRLQPLEKLRRRAWILRTKFKQAVTTDVYAAYEKSNPPDAAIANLADLRADLEKILEEFHWLYTACRARDERLRRMKSWLVLILGLSVVVLGVIVGEDKPSTLGVIMVSGMAGALMSIVRRSQAVASAPLSGTDPVLDLSGLQSGFVGIVIALVSGAVFATLLYMLFIAGASDIVGKLVPTIETEPNCKGMYDVIVRCSTPKTGADFAKLAVWSFLAGFGERLVPDVLDRIAQQDDTEKKK
jgi:hypothetical protein